MKEQIPQPENDSIDQYRYKPADYRINVPPDTARTGIEESCPDLEIENMEPYSEEGIMN